MTRGGPSTAKDTLSMPRHSTAEIEHLSLFADDPGRLSGLAIDRQVGLDRGGESLGRAAGGLKAQIGHFLFDVWFGAYDG